jgi:hypothetical protein
MGITEINRGFNYLHDNKDFIHLNIFKCYSQISQITLFETFLSELTIIQT